MVIVVYCKLCFKKIELRIAVPNFQLVEGTKGLLLIVI
jgi:hypothetical protein